MDGFGLHFICFGIVFFIQVVAGQFIKDAEILRRVDGHANATAVKKVVTVLKSEAAKNWGQEHE